MRCTSVNNQVSNSENLIIKEQYAKFIIVYLATIFAKLLSNKLIQD